MWIGISKKNKTDPQTKISPVVILISSDEEKDLIESYQLGTNRYVREPVVFNNYQNAVK